MSISSALNAGVSGLKGQSMKLATLSDNIANSATTGYKRRDVAFSDLVVGNGVSQTTYTAAGTIGTVRTEISREGTVTASGGATDIAIAGRGFFVVGAQANPADGAANEMSLTRAGAFAPDAQGFLRNTAGQYLQGFPLNTDGTYVDGAVSFDTFNDLQTVNIQNLNFVGDPTTEVRFSGNLPADLTGVAPPGQPLITAVEYFDELGASQRVTLEWQPTATPNQWTLTVYNGPDTASPVLASDAVTFNAGGPDAGTPAAYGPGLGVGADGVMQIAVGPTQTIDLSLGAPGALDGISQFVGEYTPSTTRDGAAAGRLERVEIEEDGMLYAVYDNGSRRAAWQIPVGDVVNPDGLRPNDGGTFDLTGDSGTFRMWGAGEGPAGTMTAGFVEGSNVDIAEELTQLIQTQRAYSSNATIVRTADEMLEETTRLKR